MLKGKRERDRKKKEAAEKILALADEDFIRETAPQTGISFADDKYIKTGDGYMVCLYVYKYPAQVSDNWLYELTTALSGSAVIIDVKPEDANKVKRNISRSMEEQESRFQTAKTHAAARDAQYRFSELDRMYEEIEHLGKIMDQICVRIFVPGKTLAEIDDKVRDVINAVDKYRLGICLFESQNDYRAMLRPLSAQQLGIYKKDLQPVPGSTLAAGNPFHFSKLEDPLGFYWGSTDTGGSVLLDIFHRTRQRLSYNFACLGMMGSGKSTTLKKLFQDRAIRGDKIRVFDVTDEFRELTLTLGGKVIALDGKSGNMINALQIFHGGETQATFSVHMSKVSTIYKYLRPGAGDIEVMVFEKALAALYEELGIARGGDMAIDIDTYPADSYPIWSDFLSFIERKIEEMESEGKNGESEYTHYANIRTVIENLCSTYGSIFNGHTTLKEIFSEQILCFDIKNLSKMKSEIFDAQIYSALSLVWDNAVTVGGEMKELYDNHQIAWEDIKHTLILVDEIHLWLNASKVTGIKQVARFCREGRKYFCGIGLATQRMSDLIPDNASAAGIDEIKTLFDLSTYKFLMRQAENEKSKIISAMGDSFSDSELEELMTLDRGQTMLSIAGVGNIKFDIYVTQDELDLYKGGA